MKSSRYMHTSWLTLGMPLGAKLLSCHFPPSSITCIAVEGGGLLVLACLWRHCLKKCRELCAAWWSHKWHRAALTPWSFTLRVLPHMSLQSPDTVFAIKGSSTVWWNVFILCHRVNQKTLYLYWTTVKFCSPQCLAHRMYLIQLDLLGSPPSIKCCSVPSWSYIWGRCHKIKSLEKIISNHFHCFACAALCGFSSTLLPWGLSSVYWYS